MLHGRKLVHNKIIIQNLGLESDDVVCSGKANAIFHHRRSRSVRPLSPSVLFWAVHTLEVLSLRHQLTAVHTKMGKICSQTCTWLVFWHFSEQYTVSRQTQPAVPAAPDWLRPGGGRTGGQCGGGWCHSDVRSWGRW